MDHRERYLRKMMKAAENDLRDAKRAGDVNEAQAARERRDIYASILRIREVGEEIKKSK